MGVTMEERKVFDQTMAFAWAESRTNVIFKIAMMWKIQLISIDSSVTAKAFSIMLFISHPPSAIHFQSIQSDTMIFDARNVELFLLSLRKRKRRREQHTHTRKWIEHTPLTIWQIFKFLCPRDVWTWITCWDKGRRRRRKENLERKTDE